MATGSNSTANVSLGKGVQGGYFYAAALGTELPEDCTTELEDEWTCLGYIVEDGITESPDEDTTEMADMNGDVILKVTSKSGKTFSLQLAETKAATLEQYFGGDCVTDEAGVITVVEVSGKREAMAYVFDLLLSGDRRYRIVIPNGIVTEADDVTYSSGEVVAWGITVDALPDDDGAKTYRYIQSTETEAA